MPSTYAHFTFGRHVLKNIDKEVSEIINKNLPLFHIGLHGPDILFYYKPLISNPIKEKGHVIHTETGLEFLMKAREKINHCSDLDAACAYIMGFICHFMLDSECHPYIREIEESGIAHSEIETEFERELMIRDNIKPISHKPTGHIIPDIKYAKYISMFFDGISSKDILKSLKSMKFYLNLLVAPGFLKRTLIIKALKYTKNYDNMGGLIMNYQPNPACKSSNEKLSEIYTKAIIPTADIVNEFFRSLSDEKPLNIRLNRNFG